MKLRESLGGGRKKSFCEKSCKTGFSEIFSVKALFFFFLTILFFSFKPVQAFSQGAEQGVPEGEKASQRSEQTFLETAKSSQGAVKIALMKSFSSVSYSSLYEDPSYGFIPSENEKEAILLLSEGKADAAIFSIPASCLLYEYSNGNLLCAGVTQECDFYCISSVSSAKNLSDLLGKKVYAPKGGLFQAVTTWILEKSDIPLARGKGGVTVNWEDNPSNVTAKMLYNDTSFVFLSEPGAAAILKHPRFHTVVDFSEEYESIIGGKDILPKNLLLVRKDFYMKNRDKYEKLCLDMEKSAVFIGKNPLRAANLTVKHGGAFPTASMSKCVKGGKFVFVPSDKARHSVLSVTEIYNSYKKGEDKLPVPKEDFFILPGKNN